MHFLQTLLIALFLFGTSTLFSQDLIINYTEPDELIVCDSNDFVFTLTNASPDTLLSIGVTVNMPTGLEYVAGSISNGNELDISNPTAPIFSYPQILPFESIEFTISTELKCDLVTSINSGALFTNTISAEWDGGNNSITTLPFIIETPLLVITDISNALTSATKGETITRTITIRNTRLGALPSFRFTDNHLGGIAISSTLGTIISSTGNSFVLELDGDDFMTVGDGDDLFEKDEVIVITEVVEILDCGFVVPFTNSDYEVSWGCYNQVCQVASQNATIDIIPSSDNPFLIFDAYSILPDDYCAGQSAQQGVTIKNVGTHEAEEVNLSIDLGYLLNTPSIGAGLDPNTFVQDSSGVITSVVPEVSFPTANTNCSFPNGLYQLGQLSWPNIAPSDSIVLTWDYYYCADPTECGSLGPDISLHYSYINHCPADTVTGTAGLSSENMETNFGLSLRDSLYYEFGEPLVNSENYLMNYVVKSDQLTGTGLLNIEFTLPCGFSWAGSPLELGGQLPASLDVASSGNETIVNATYNLPLDSNWVLTQFEVTFNCDPNCGPGLGACEVPYITENGEIGCGSEEQILMTVTIQEDPSIPLECSMQLCRAITLVVDCNSDDFPGPGNGGGALAFLFSNHEFQRCNYDFPDNDDDRLPDPSGNLDFDKVRTDRAIPGDTVTNVFNSRITIPGGGSIPNLDIDLMTVQFEAHTMDHGLNGGQALDFERNGSLFASGGITHVSANIRIFDASTGTSFECEIGNPMLVVDSIYQEFHVVNTEPIIPIDELLYNQFKYNTSLSNIPCLPAGFEYQDGDSIIFTTKHRMVYNPLPQNLGSYIPPVVNMRAAVVPIFCNIFNPFISALPQVHTKWQYSGYRYQILGGVFHALPCEPFTDPGGMELAFVLGQDNFFPFEYRPLATLEKWRIQFPPNIDLLDSKLAYLRYQEGANILLAEDLNFTLNNGFHEFEVDQWHMPTLDEGWQMRFFHEFETECIYTSFDSTVFNVEMLLNTSLPEPSNMNLTRAYDNFISASPVLNAAVNVANYSSFDNQAIWDLVILNPSNGITEPAINVWLRPVSQSGLLTDFQLVNTNTGAVIPQTNGIFQLGTLDLNQLVNYQLTATNISCETEVLQVYYGWNCTPYTSIAQNTCSNKSIIFTATSPNGELEMDIESPAGPFELCDVIDYHTVEVYNAQLGNVFDVVLEATLPLGLQLVPNSSQMAYPTDDPFIDIPDPVNVAGNVYQWDISAINDSIQNNGLLGVSQDPGNSVSVRFLTTTDCGFVAGSQIVFNVVGKQNCDDPTNSLSKAGDPINIAGINPQYSTDINIAITSSTSITCDASVPLNINILPDGPTSNADTVLVTLPPGVSYVPGSYTPINNASSSPPIIFNNGGQEILKVKIIDGLPANTLISFEIETTGYGAVGCGDQTVQVQAVQRQDAVCSTTGELCYVLAATGSGTIMISSEHPDLSLQNLEIVAHGDSINYEINISNTGITNTSDIQVDFYIDSDGDGTLSSGDVYIDSGIHSGNILTNQTITFNGNFNLSPDQLCNLIAVIDEDNNCVCSSETIPVTTPISSILDNEVVCSGVGLEIGVDAINGHTYQWIPPGNISSSNNAMTVFQFSNTASDTSYFDFTLIDDNGEGCEVHHEIEIAVIPIPGINQQDLEICAGETITLTATPGGTYVWEGPNISNPNTATQTVTLFDNATFSVMITLPEGCEGMDEINVEVLPYELSTTQLEKCPEETVIIMGQEITAAGFYCDTISNVMGCDSLLCVEVINYTSETESIRELCAGDSIVIEGITYFDEQQICNTYTSLYGCDSTHCINIQLITEPLAEVITADFAVAEGEEIQLEVTPGFEMYEWFPTTGLSCTDCHNPIASPSETTEYTVTLTDENGCTTQLFVLVTVLPPCNADRLLIPNVFTPDGDGLNDSFGVVEYEGFERISSIKVFDRWGEKVYENAGTNPYWDGTIDGQPGPSDVYVYILTIVCSDGETILHGDVTLIR